ncbi:MAG: transposase [Candidatus Kerfeldbacteria bacterium]|nr:transposase [Candidatus Kerfeldbacteria bacterium]
MRKIILPFQSYFVTTNIAGRRWVFVHRNSLEPQVRPCDIAVQNLGFYRKKFNYALHGYVLMPDHVHLLITVGRFGTISEILRDWKHRTASEINQRLGTSGRIWQRDFWEHSIRNAADFRQKMNYIHMNPARAGLVEKAEDWPYSSASWYINKRGPIHIDAIS